MQTLFKKVWRPEVNKVGDPLNMANINFHSPFKKQFLKILFIREQYPVKGIAHLLKKV